MLDPCYVFNASVIPRQFPPLRSGKISLAKTISFVLSRVGPGTRYQGGAAAAPSHIGRCKGMFDELFCLRVAGLFFEFASALAFFRTFLVARLPRLRHKGDKKGNVLVGIYPPRLIRIHTCDVSLFTVTPKQLFLSSLKIHSDISCGYIASKKLPLRNYPFPSLLCLTLHGDDDDEDNGILAFSWLLFFCYPFGPLTLS